MIYETCSLFVVLSFRYYLDSFRYSFAVTHNILVLLKVFSIANR